MFLDKLQEFSIFKGFSADQLDMLIKSDLIKFKSYTKGETIHNLGEPCSRIDLVLSGSLTAYNLTENGSAISIFNFASKSLIGCNLIFSEQNKYPLNIYCTSNCTVAYIPKETIEELLLKNNIFVMEFIKGICNYSTNMKSKILILSNKNLRERILDFLNKEKLVQGSNKIKLKITKKQLANELGVQRPSLFRELKNMRDENIIDYDSNSITLN